MRISVFVLGLFCMTACHNKGNNPDVSNIKVNLETKRFEQAFFRIDSSRFANGLDSLIAKYPSFGENFLYTILNADPRWRGDSTAMYVKSFYGAYQNVYDSAEKIFGDFSKYTEEIKQSLKYLKYYFPAYKAPTKVVTYIGPLDGYGDILDVDEFIVGLQHHLGSGFSLYQSEMVQGVYPSYITANFTPTTIVVNCMKNVIKDMYNDEKPDGSLVVQMVEKGKRLYLLKRLIPSAPEETLIGYTSQQFKDSKAKEKVIWALFVQNNLLQSKDASVNKTYIGESPKTAELGEAAPGNIGSFAGWQIVNYYMEKFPETPMDSLMKMDADQLFAAAKYKP